MFSKTQKTKGLYTWMLSKVRACVCVCLRLKQRTHSSRLLLARFMRPEGTRGRVASPQGNQLGPSKRSTLLGAVGKLHTLALSLQRCRRRCSRWRPYMALGFPWKKKPGIEEEGGKCWRDCNCMFHLGFRSTAKTIAALESQISFHVRGSKGKWVRRGQAEGSDGRAEMAESNPVDISL